MRAVFLCEEEARLNGVYAQGRRQHLESLANFYPVVVGEKNFEAHAEALQDVQVAFSTWGMPRLTAEQIARLPQLKAVFYAAGSVQYFGRPFIEGGIQVFSAWAANAVPVAEYTLAQIILANKSYFSNVAGYDSPDKMRRLPRSKGNFGATVALLGAGQIGRRVIELLQPFHLKIVVFDPFLTDEAAATLGVEKVSLEDAFRQGHVVSNHLANLPATVKMLKGEHFALMQEFSTFINTGRGATVAEAELIEVLQIRPDITALLDVTHPEPPVAGSPLYTLPNVWLTPHIAGSNGDEVVRMADYMIEEFQAWREGLPTQYSVSLEMLDTMA